MYMWHQAHLKDPKNVVDINLWEYTHVAAMIVCRCVVMGAKYGMFSNEQFMLLRNLKMSGTFRMNRLIMVMLTNKNTDFQLDKLRTDFEALEIEETEFNVQVYKDQTQFRIKNSRNLMRRLKDINIMNKHFSNEEEELEAKINKEEQNYYKNRLKTAKASCP